VLDGRVDDYTLYDSLEDVSAAADSTVAVNPQVQSQA
jgi:hypothetical protein